MKTSARTNSPSASHTQEARDADSKAGSSANVSGGDDAAGGASSNNNRDNSEPDEGTSAASKTQDTTLPGAHSAGTNKEAAAETATQSRGQGGGESTEQGSG